MKHWREIPGWWEDEWLFKMIVDEAPDRATFVEVGSWMGRSAACMAQCIQASGKDILLWCVDTFKGSQYGSHPEKVAALKAEGKTLFGEFTSNIDETGSNPYIVPCVSTSVEAAKGLHPRLFSVFIDADHRAPAVEADIRAWLPKIQPGGIICGHDYPAKPTSPQMVKQGIEAAGLEVQSKGMVWWHRIPE